MSAAFSPSVDNLLFISLMIVSSIASYTGVRIS